MALAGGEVGDAVRRSRGSRASAAVHGAAGAKAAAMAGGGWVGEARWGFGGGVWLGVGARGWRGGRGPGYAKLEGRSGVTEICGVSGEVRKRRDLEMRGSRGAVCGI